MTHVHSLATTVLTELRAAKREDQINQAMATFAAQTGYPFYQFAPGPHNPSPDPTALLNIGSFPRSLAQAYRAERFCQHDPARAHAILRASPVRWKAAFAGAKEDGPKTFMTELRAHGLRDGVTTPVHGPQGCVALLMLAGPKSQEIQNEDEEALIHIAMALHQRVKRLAAAALFSEPPPVHLTEREVECLNWVLEGKTNWEIGVLTGVTARTVQFHLGNAARKLGVVNRVQAAVQALIRGELNTPAVIAGQSSAVLSEGSGKVADSFISKISKASLPPNSAPLAPAQAALLEPNHHVDRPSASRR
jgi:LuxR family transcriptional regulator, quorum-sensing system regulator BjaR1